MHRTPSLVVLLALALSVAGCGDDALPAVVLRFDPTFAVGEDASASAAWLAFPFPSDHRRTADGRVRFDDFPNPFGIGLLDDWTTEASATLDGFSTQGMVYLAFDHGDLDASGLGPSLSATESLTATVPIHLVDVTPDSPTFGERLPIRTRYFPVEDGTERSYLVPHTLAVGPAWGFPLEEGHTYAVLVTDELRDARGRRLGRPPLLDALLRDAPSAPPVRPSVPDALYQELRRRWSGLRDHLAAASIPATRIVAATVFTTANETEELARFADFVAAAPAPSSNGFLPQGNEDYQLRGFSWSSTASVDYAVYRGRYVAPNFQEGTLPYDSEGGALHAVGGIPTPVFDETIDFVLTVPVATATDPRGCVPLVLYGHGTGGSRNSLVTEGVGGRLAARGMAGLAIDQPLHGARAQGMALDVRSLTFNITNPQAFRSTFRQGAIDLVSLTRFARESLAIPSGSSPSGQAVSFCDETLGYMGHSQGGLSGALALPFLDDVGTFMLSAAGGGTMTSVMDREDDIDFSELIRVLLRVPDAETWNEDHPLGTLVQTLGDISDPAIYARYFQRDPRYRVPANVMLTNGTDDTMTPPRAGTILALAAALPLTTPVAIPIDSFGILGLEPIAPPFSANAHGRTSAYLQYVDDPSIPDAATHFLVFHRPEAIDASMHFLATGTSVTGLAELRRDPDADAR